MLGQSGNSMVGPASYANYVVRGDNMVTAVSYGKAMRSFDQFVARIVDNPNRPGGIDQDLGAVSEGQGYLPRTTIPSSLIKLGDRNIAVESLQKMYNEAQLPFPLNRKVQYSYYFPVGLHMPNPKYTTSNVVKGAENEFYQPNEAWIVNKNNTLLCFGFQTALKSICHPRVHNPNHCANALQNAFPDVAGEVNNYGVAFEDPMHMNLYRLIFEYYDNKRVAHISDLAKKATMSIDDMLHPTTHELLRLEIHPMFDFYAFDVPGAKAAYRATRRTMIGNIPAPLAPSSFQDCRGYQFDTATNLNHVIDAATMEIIQESAFDPNYPIICYIIEAMVHGQEEKFVMNSQLIAMIIETYFNNTGRLAFINSFFMIKFICQHLGGATISKEVYSLYRRIYGELIALHQALIKMAGHDHVAGRPVGHMVNALLDDNLLPPFVYNNIFENLFQKSNRNPEVIVGYQKARTIDDMLRMLNVVDKMDNVVGQFINIYNNRVDEDHEHRFVLDVGPNRDTDNIAVLEKIFYFVLLPVRGGR